MGWRELKWLYQRRNQEEGHMCKNDSNILRRLMTRGMDSMSAGQGSEEKRTSAPLTGENRLFD